MKITSLITALAISATSLFVLSLTTGFGTIELFSISAGLFFATIAVRDYGRSVDSLKPVAVPARHRRLERHALAA